MATSRYSVLWLAVLLVGVVPAGQAEEERRVTVTNFPVRQEVRGTVEIDAPVPHTELVRFVGNVVSPIPRAEFTNLMEVGTVKADGFTSLALSLAGEVKGRAGADSEVGVLLLPDQRPILQAFRDTGDALLAIELKAPVRGGSNGYFAGQTVVPLAFPRYRVYLYNSGRESVTANVYAYLRN